MKVKPAPCVVALMHIALLLAEADRSARKQDIARALDFTREADRISLSVFNRAASELL
jgi:hypothetical protein